MAGAMTMSPGESHGIGLKPDRHIAGFSIHKEDGTAIPLIFEAGVGKARDTVVLKLNGPVPEKASLWYGYGMDPYCNLVDGLDMAVPVFGPIALDAAEAPPATVSAAAVSAATVSAKAPESGAVKVLVITGDHGHAWKDTTKVLTEVLGAGGHFKVDVTTTPSKDLTGDNLAKYDVLLLNYKDTANGPARDTLVGCEQAGIPQGGARREGVGRLSPRLERLHEAQLGRVREGDRRRLASPGKSRAQARLHGQEDRRETPDLRGTAGPVRAHDR